MKRNLFVRLSLLAVAAVILFPVKSFAVDAIPNTSVWFTPSNAIAGSAISLNALVYNNQAQDATVTVSFKTDKAVIGTQTQLIASQSAKTLVQKWVMPSTTTVVTVSVTAAVDKNKKSIPALLGTLGTVSVGAGVTPVINSVSFPGSSQLTAWFGPLLSKIETFRAHEAVSYAILRDQTKVTLGITQVKAPTVASDGLPPLKFDNPMQYVTLVYATACASFFGSAAVFYIGCILIILLAVRFVVNLFV